MTGIRVIFCRRISFLHLLSLFTFTSFHNLLLLHIHIHIHIHNPHLHPGTNHLLIQESRNPAGPRSLLQATSDFLLTLPTRLLIILWVVDKKILEKHGNTNRKYWPSISKILNIIPLTRHNKQALNMMFRPAEAPRSLLSFILNT